MRETLCRDPRAGHLAHPAGPDPIWLVALQYLLTFPAVERHAGLGAGVAGVADSARRTGSDRRRTARRLACRTGHDFRWKPLWLGGPVGLDLQHVEQAEFLVEAVLAWLGWRLLTRANAPRWLTTKTALLVMLAAQLVYLSSSYNDRPADKRCLAYPFAACWRKL